MFQGMAADLIEAHQKAPGKLPDKLISIIKECEEVSTRKLGQQPWLDIAPSTDNGDFCWSIHVSSRKTEEYALAGMWHTVGILVKNGATVFHVDVAQEEVYLILKE